MSNLRRHMTSDKTKWMITFVLIALLAVGVIFAVVKLNKQITTQTIGTTAYSIGMLDEKGEYAQDTSSIYTKNHIKTDGLQCELAENARITYKLYFYDKDKEFLSATTAQSTDYAGEIPETAKYVKIVITPTNDAEVSIFEKGDYAQQLTVTVNK